MSNLTSNTSLRIAGILLGGFLFLFRPPCVAQADTDYPRYQHFHNGNIKSVVARKGTDTFELKKYYRNGKIRDSLWLCLTEKDEIPLGTSKSFFENGQVATITHHDGPEKYVNYEYFKDGKLRRFEQKPTGVTRFYNRKGQQVVEYDYHKLRDVYVPAAYRKGRHLQNSGFGQRIRSDEAFLTGDAVPLKLYSGSLVSVKLRKDTSLITHCLLEGFSPDSLYLSHFHYNEKYERRSSEDILKYDSTFAIPVSAVKTLYYARHRTKKRLNAALFSTIAGAELILLPIVPLAVLPFLGAPVLAVAYLYAGCALPGTGLFFLGKHFFKTAVPQRYDLGTNRIVLKR